MSLIGRRVMRKCLLQSRGKRAFSVASDLKQHSHKYMTCQYDEVPAMIKDKNTLVLREPHYFPGVENKVFDISWFAIMQQRFKMPQMLFYSSIYACWNFWSLGAYNYLALSAAASSLCGFWYGSNKFLSNIMISQLSVLPCGERVSLLTYQTKQYTVPLRYFELVFVE